MQLSEAIEKGAQLRPQAFGAYFTGSTRTDACSCAIGAAYEATFKDMPLAHDGVVNDFERLAAHYPLLYDDNKIYCPECAGAEVKQDNLCNILIHLNDDHRWTREEIAGYVRGFEQ
jgi:hypothetical protein